MSSNSQKEADKLLAAERAAIKHTFARLKNWRILTKLRLSARYTSAILRALLVWTNTEVAHARRS